LSLAPADSAARATERKGGTRQQSPARTHTRADPFEDPFEDQERSERSDHDVRDDDDDDDDADERTSLRTEDKIEGPDRRPSLVRARTSCGSGRSCNYSCASCELTLPVPVLPDALPFSISRGYRWRDARRGRGRPLIRPGARARRKAAKRREGARKRRRSRQRERERERERGRRRGILLDCDLFFIYRLAEETKRPKASPRQCIERFSPLSLSFLLPLAPSLSSAPSIRQGNRFAVSSVKIQLTLRPVPAARLHGRL